MSADDGNETLGVAVSRDVVIYTAGAIVANGFLYLAVPIYTRAFSPAAYGQVVLVTAFSGMVAGLLVLGGDTALARFWFQTKDEVARRRLAFTWIGFLAAVAVAACLLLAPLAPTLSRFFLDRPDGSTLLLLALAALPVTQTSRMVAQVLRNQFRPVPFVLTSILLGAASLGLGVLFALVLDLGLAGIFLGVLVAEALVLAARLGLTRSAFSGPVDREALRGLLRFGVPLVPVTVSFWVFTAADRLIVGKLAGPAELGFYGVAVTVTLVFMVLTGAVSQAWLPRAIHLFEEDPGAAAAGIGRSLTYYVFGLGVIACGFATLAPEITWVLSGSGYEPAADAIPTLSLGSVVYGTTTVTAIGMTLMHRNGPLALLSLAAAAVNVLAALALVPPFGIVGAAVAGVVGYSVLTVSYLRVSQRLWHFPLEHKRLAVLLALLLAATVVTTVFLEAPLWLRLLVPPAYVVLTLLMAGTHPDERLALRRLLRRGT